MSGGRGDHSRAAGSGAGRILLLGANRSNMHSIRAARRAGFYTVAADPHPESAGLREADLAWTVDVRDCDRILAGVAEIGGVDGIISMSEVGVEAAAHLCKRLNLPSISEAAAATLRSKAAMRRLLAGTRFSVEFEVVESEPHALSCAERLGFPLIFKPDRSFGGSRGVSRVESVEQVGGAFRFARESGLPGTSVVIERCVAGAEFSCEVLIHDRCSTLLCIGEKVKSPYPYRVDFSVQYPAALSPEQEGEVGRMCQAAVEALGLDRGAAHFEFAYSRSGPRLFEIGARCGGGHTPQIAHVVSGVDEFLEACRTACGVAPSGLNPERHGGADYRFVILPPGRVAAVHLPEAVAAHPAVLDAAILLKSGDDIHSVQSTSDRAGFVVTRGSSRAEAVGLADWACSQISVTYSDGALALPLILGNCSRGRLDCED